MHGLQVRSLSEPGVKGPSIALSSPGRAGPRAKRPTGPDPAPPDCRGKKNDTAGETLGAGAESRPPGAGSELQEHGGARELPGPTLRGAPGVCAVPRLRGAARLSRQLRLGLAGPGHYAVPVAPLQCRPWLQWHPRQGQLQQPQRGSHRAGRSGRGGRGERRGRGGPWTGAWGSGGGGACVKVWGHPGAYTDIGWWAGQSKVGA